MSDILNERDETTREPTKFYAQALFLHDRLLFSRLPEKEAHRLEEQRSLLRTEMERTNRLVADAERIALRIFESRPEELAVWLMQKRAVGDNAVLTTRQAFNFRKVNEERKAFRAEFAVDKDVLLEGRFSTSRCVGSTGIDTLSRKRNVSILGHFQIIETNPKMKIEITPLFIGSIVERAASERAPDLDFTGRRQLHPGEIDQFSKADFSKRPTSAILKEIAEMPEEEIKKNFAEIIGEPYVGLDWGGENSDLFTSRVTVEGKSLSAAFAFKGPGQQGRLTVARMGKNGDQGLRLFNQSIDIAVVQHYRDVDPAVSHLMDALARKNNAQYLILDGVSTATIFKAYGRLKTTAE